jgi:hypothetical protein
VYFSPGLLTYSGVGFMDEEQMSRDAGVINYCILTHIAQWLQETGASDMTEVDDPYILRQMARLDCFSLADVRDARDRLRSKLALPHLPTDGYVNG